MPTIEIQDLPLDCPERSKTIRSYLHRNASRKKVVKMLERLQDAEFRGASPEPIDMPMDFRAWAERINRLWPM